MSDIVERLRANMDKYPGFENMNTEAATEIERLRELVAFNEDQRRMLFDAAIKLEADRDRWKTEALAARPFIDMGRIEAWQPDGFHPGIPTHIAYKAARAANGEVPND